MCYNRDFLTSEFGEKRCIGHAKDLGMPLGMSLASFHPSSKNVEVFGMEKAQLSMPKIAQI
jgi:hypothetical protein